MSYVYVGTELDLFAAAAHWKSYIRRQVRRYLGREVLEVGAGNGNTTRVLCQGEVDRWVCMEPDSSLADRLIAAIGAGLLPRCCRIRIGTLADLGDQDFFDTILYIDVLEHIADDRAELAAAAMRLKAGGHLVVLVPAHQWLFTPFDTAIGHFRRYTKGTLRSTAPEGLALVRLVYLDAIGMLASLGNRLALRSSMPSERQIAVWDRLMVPLSRLVDPWLGYSLGKSVLAVWQQSNGTDTRGSVRSGLELPVPGGSLQGRESP
jgi:SAM-dependent methyltransferase